MKIHVEVDETASEPDVTIRAAANTDVSQLVAALEAASASAKRLTLRQRGQNYQVRVGSILFLEAADHQVMVHTADDVYVTRQPLYELADALPTTFQRVSKSAILNREQILSLTKSVTGNLVKFQKSHKQLYVSRRYYKALKEALEREG
ncbi:LytTR family DNA-binding domain-containing protein [Levilactobacillus yiduensis]|uniref:LytTR family DNA-binding domain-containing protein n=1 Tax=Levilactobacillus yiduensis TaxID=2953880 RepID=UPI000EF2B54B|nr:LytTR family DNA-binding domain-containing protein [Levilactobacillus yiduensis]AYM03750.1 LytTR family transcriptional regulator [Levilactobacillus brevis]